MSRGQCEARVRICSSGLETPWPMSLQWMERRLKSEQNAGIPGTEEGLGELQFHLQKPHCQSCHMEVSLCWLLRVFLSTLWLFWEPSPPPHTGPLFMVSAARWQAEVGVGSQAAPTVHSADTCVDS